MNLYLKEYLEYIGGNPDTKVVKEFVCDGFRGDEIPALMGIKPAGRFLIYPEFCAFLTTMRGEQNSFRLFVTRFWDEMAGELRLAGLASRPEMLIFYVARSLGRDKDEEEKKCLRAALSNPNSFFIPMREVRSVSTGRKWGQNSITIDTASGKFTLLDNFMTTVTDPITYAMKKLTGGRPLGKPSLTGAARYYGRFVSGRWEEDAVRILEKAARSNRSTAGL